MPNAINDQILNVETDKLNALIRLAEEAIAAQRLGVAATVEIPSLGGYVSFAKVEQQWGLWYSRRASDVTVAALTAVSREVRVAAVRVLPALYAEMLAQVDLRLTEVREAQKVVQAFIDSIDAPAKE